MGRAKELYEKIRTGRGPMKNGIILLVCGVIFFGGVATIWGLDLLSSGEVRENKLATLDADTKNFETLRVSPDGEHYGYTLSTDVNEVTLFLDGKSVGTFRGAAVNPIWIENAGMWVYAINEYLQGGAQTYYVLGDHKLGPFSTITGLNEIPDTKKVSFAGRKGNEIISYVVDLE